MLEASYEAYLNKALFYRPSLKKACEASSFTKAFYKAGISHRS